MRLDVAIDGNPMEGHLRRDPATESEGIGGLCHALVRGPGKSCFCWIEHRHQRENVGNLKSDLDHSYYMLL